MRTPLLHPFGPEIWLSDGPEVDVVGFRYPTRMAVVRLTGGGLLIWSPIALSVGLNRDLAELGPVQCVVAPNALHDRFLVEWVQGYPDARFYGAPGLTLRLSDQRIHRELTDEPPPEWVEDLDQVVVRGNRITTEVVFFHRASGTVLFTDLLQQFAPGWFQGWRGLVARLDLMTQPMPTVPRKFRAAFTDRAAARSALRLILAWPASKVVMAHGQPVEENGRAFIARAFRWLTG
jgi:hypothetical protein